MSPSEPVQNDDSSPDDPGHPGLHFRIYGTSEGVMLSHNNMTVNTRDAIEFFFKKEDGCAASLLPYWHCFALSTEMFAPLIKGMRVFVPRDKMTFRGTFARPGLTYLERAQDRRHHSNGHLEEGPKIRLPGRETSFEGYRAQRPRDEQAACPSGSGH